MDTTNEKFNWNSFNKINAGCIEYIKDLTRQKIKKYIKSPNKSYGISLIGIGHNYKENNSLSGVYQIDLASNNFIDKNKYFAKVVNNSYVEIIIEK